jgi:AcrR family transcriptional regulator
MAGGTKRLPRAVREQQMLDAAVQMFSINGYHDTSMDAIAAKAEISKPMLYLYYGSKEELFGACLDREMTRFVDGVREEIDLSRARKTCCATLSWRSCATSTPTARRGS